MFTITQRATQAARDRKAGVQRDGLILDVVRLVGVGVFVQDILDTSIRLPRSGLNKSFSIVALHYRSSY